MMYQGQNNDDNQNNPNKFSFLNIEPISFQRTIANNGSTHYGNLQNIILGTS